MKVPKARQLPNGKWFIQLRLKQPDGKTKSIPVTEDTEKLCTATAAAIKAGLIKQRNDPGPMTLGQACDAYIKSGDLLSPSTIAGYKRIRNNLFQSIMPVKLSALTNDMIQKEVNSMVKDNKSWKYISNGLSLLRSSLRVYHKDFVLDIKPPHNKATKSRQKKRAKKLALPTNEEVTQILNAAIGSNVELPILMAMWLGMRISEIRGLRFKDIEGNLMHICNVIVDDYDGNPAEKDTKSDDSDRWIDIPEYILSLIPDGDPEEYVIKESGQAIYKRYSRLLENNGIRHFRFHDLRCVNAAAMIRLNIDSKYAMEHNGWKTEHLYKQVYGYVMADQLKEETGKVDTYFMQKMNLNQK